MLGLGSSLLEKTQTILNKSLDANLMRWNTLSNNIANANTPNFKRSDVTFAAQMKRALDSENFHPDIVAKKTDAKHFDFDDTLDYNTVDPKIQTEFYTSISNNGNNVDRAHESGEALKTSLLYDASTSLVQRNFELVNNMLK